MFDIVGKRYWYFALSATFILLGIAAMVYSTVTIGTPLRLSIDFTSGALWEIRFEKPIQPAEVRDVFVDEGFTDTSVQTTADEMTALIRSKPLEPEQRTALAAMLHERFGTFEERRFESVGPTVGREVTRTATIATVAAALVILIFIIIAFRKVPNAFRYGVCAIAAFDDKLVNQLLDQNGLDRFIVYLASVGKKFLE